MTNVSVCVLRAAMTALVFMAAQPATALDIVAVFDPGLAETLNPCDPDPNSQLDAPLAACGHTPDLVRIVEAAAAHWESIIRDDHTLVLRYGWLAPSGGTLPDAKVIEVDGAGRPVVGRLRIPPNSSWYYDQTPDTDEEYPMRPKLLRTMRQEEVDDAIDGEPIEIFEVAYNGMNTSISTDLLSTVLHEMGHVLGYADNVISADPNPACTENELRVAVPPEIAGAAGVALNGFSDEQGSRDCAHLALGGIKSCRFAPGPGEDPASNSSTDPSTTPGIRLHECFEHQALMWQGFLPGRRVRPGLAEIGGLATAADWRDLHLPRSYLRRTGFLDQSQTWLGGRVPGPDDPVFVVRQAESSEVSVLRVRQDAGIASLYVADSDRVAVQEGRLAVRELTTIAGPGSEAGPLRPQPGTANGSIVAPTVDATIRVRTGAVLVSQEGVVEPGARLDMRGGRARFVRLENRGVLVGNGRVELVDRLRSEALVIARGGTLTIATDTPPDGSITLMPPRLDLDGGETFGATAASLRAEEGDLMIDGVLSDPLHAHVVVGPGRSITFTSGWEQPFSTRPQHLLHLVGTSPQAEIRGDSRLGGRVVVDGLGRFVGDLTLAPSARVELQATGQPGQGDLVIVTGRAVLAGTLTLGFAAGFVPAAGNEIPLMTYAAHEGAFSAVEMPDLPDDLDLQIEYRTDGVFAVAAVGCGGNVIEGTPGADVLFGTPGSDTISGGGGNDLIFAGAGDDCVDAGDGDDVVWAGPGDDTVEAGGNPQDFVSGGPGQDACSGAAILLACEGP